MDKFIPQIEPWFGQEEKDALCAYMDQGGWVTEFQQTVKFEQMIASYTGAKHCIVTNSGTVALTLAAMACNIGIGDEVIVPNYTMIATPNSVKILGASLIFVDVEIATLCLDIEKVRNAITPKTKAVILVSANGRYPKNGVGEFIDLAKQHQLILIEDSAQSLGSFYPNRQHIGTIGQVGIFSFSAPKIISTGQGGAIITNNDDLAANIKKLKDFGRSGGRNDIHDSIGYNFKFTDIQACLGIEQMKKLPWRVNRKKSIYKTYKELLKDVHQIKFFQQDLVHTTPWFIDVLAERRDELQKHLKACDIGTRAMYPPINRQKAYGVGGKYPISELIGENGLWLPSSSQLKNDEISYICSAIINFYKKSRPMRDFLISKS